MRDQDPPGPFDELARVHPVPPEAPENAPEIEVENCETHLADHVGLGLDERASPLDVSEGPFRVPILELDLAEETVLFPGNRRAGEQPLAERQALLAVLACLAILANRGQRLRQPAPALHHREIVSTRGEEHREGLAKDRDRL